MKSLFRLAIGLGLLGALAPLSIAKADHASRESHDRHDGGHRRHQADVGDLYGALDVLQQAQQLLWDRQGYAAADDIRYADETVRAVAEANDAETLFHADFALLDALRALYDYDDETALAHVDAAIQDIEQFLGDSGDSGDHGGGRVIILRSLHVERNQVST